MSAPLVDDGVLSGTIDNCRDILAVVAAATIDPSQAWDRTAHGVHILLMQIDTALAEVFPSDEADPSLDPECLPVHLALLPADVARLDAVATRWGVLPATLAQTLVVDALNDIGRREQGGRSVTTRSRQRREQRADKSRRRWHKDDESRGNPIPPPRRSGPRARGRR